MGEEADEGPDRGAVGDEIHAQDAGLTRGDGQQTGAGPEQRGLPGPVRTAHHHDLARIDVEIDTGERREPAEERDRGAEVDNRLHWLDKGY